MKILTKEQISKLPFEEALKNLEEVVQTLEEAPNNLEHSINLYIFGENLKKHCESELAKAKLKVDKFLNIAKNGDPETTDFESS